MPMIFCCGATDCTGSSVCESSTGRVSQCSNPDGGVLPDAGVVAAACTGNPLREGPREPALLHACLRPDCDLQDQRGRNEPLRAVR